MRTARFLSLTRIIPLLCVTVGILPGFAAEVSPPFYQVHYAGSTNEGELKLGVTYNLWVPPGVKVLRGVIVHQHGCSKAANKHGATAANDLHWQALARKHACALLGPEYKELGNDDCPCWSDPRSGSGEQFQQALADLAQQSHHPELATVPWALWGHSGGARWAGTLFLLHPERTVGVWLRSGGPFPATNNAVPPPIPDAAGGVPVMCNLGTTEGVTVKTNTFAPLWEARMLPFFKELRGQGGLVGIAIDPKSGHDCGNSRYLAIPWFDACLTARLPEQAGDATLKSMPTGDAWLAPLLGTKATPASKFKGEVKIAVWLPNQRVAKAWSEYVKNGDVSDATPPPPPHNVRVNAAGELTWEAEADFESGIAAFVIERDGRKLARLEQPAGLFYGRRTFQRTGYGDTPTPPLAVLRYQDTTATPGRKHTYTVQTLNTVGLKSRSALAVVAPD